MKHNSLISANGFHTPIASTTVKSSVLTTIFKPLLLLLLLVMGSSVVWAGWRFQGQNGSNEQWDRGDNMTQVGSSDIWYYKISNLNADIQFKINNGSWNDNNQKYWSANHDDQNRGNVQLEDANDGDKDGKNRFKYSRNTNFGKNVARDLYIFVKGDANNPSTSDRVWAVATPVGESALSPSTTYKMRGDLFLGSTNNNGWADIDQAFVPTFERLANHVAERITLLVPQPANSQTVQIRLEVKSDNTKSISVDADGSNVTLTQNSTKVLITIPGTGNDNTNVKKLTISHYASHKISAVLSDATTGDDWYVYVDKRNKGQLSQGKLTVSSLGSGNHSIFLAKGNISSDTEISNPNSQGWAHCLSWLGGLHINKNGSDVNWADQYQYSDGDRFSSSSVKWPLKGQFDGRGQFNLASASDVYVRLQNGVITLSTTPPADITYTGNEFMFLSKQQKNSGDGNIFNFTADGAHLFVYFWNSETSANAWSDEAFMWDSGDNVLGAKVPAGTWTNCKVVRKNSNDSGKNWNNVWNESHDQTLEAGKNYLRTGESSVWAVYTPPFYLTGSNALCGAEWGYTGNGTTYNGSATRTNIPAGTYQFKLNPTKNYNDWAHQINYTHVASSGSNVTLSSHSDNQIQFTLSEASDVTIAYDGYGVTVNATPYAPPAVTRTVTIHPNNGAANFTMDVADGGTISSIAATYGNGIASWYKDAELTQAFTLNSSTVTEDMDLYAKWGVSGNFYLVGDFGMHDKGSNWAYNSGLAMTTTDGVASVTYIAPKGRHRFEILTGRSSWPAIANQGSGLIAASTPTLSWSNEGAGGNYHFRFDLDAPKKVTVRYDGKVSVTAEDYVVAKTGWTVASKSLFGHGTEESPDNADDGAYMNGYNMTEGQMNSDGELVIHNLNAGTYKFWIGKYNTALNKQKQNVEVFGAAHVDKANSSLGDYGSLANVSDDTYNRSIPMDDKLHRRVQFTLTQTASIKIAFDGGKITVNLQPKYTVSFNSEGGSEVASQSVFEGAQASEPSAPTKAGYEFVKWQLSGADYSFSSAVTGNITLDAVWAYKPIESVALSESTHMTWVGNTDFSLTPTLTPSDAIAKSVAWSSNATGVATVSDGTIHAVAAGEARITCTVTDQFDQQVSAYCDVTVAACEMATENLYSMTVTGYNTSTDPYATLSYLWNESSDNDGPATLEKVKIEYKDNSGNNQAPIAVDADHRVKAISGLSDESDYWYRIPTGETIINGSHTYDVYYLKNVKTGEFIYVDKSTEYGHNGDYWHYWATRTSATNAETDIYKWFTAVNYNQGDHRNVIVCKDGFNNTYSGDGARTNIGLYRTDVNPSTEWSDPLIKCGQKVMNGYQNAHTGMVPSVTSENIPNPNYKASLMNGSYYRMNTDATVRANLNAALVSGAVITVRLYADANTTVKLQKTDGTEIETVNLSADAEHEYSYTVASNSALLGEDAFVIKAVDNHAGIASIVVTRTYAVRLAQLIEETEIGGTLTLTCDYATDNAVIDKAITINGGNHTIGDLKIENTGDLTLSSGLTVRDFTICAKAGNTTTPAASGQVRNAANLTCNRNAYFLYTVDPSGQVHYGWYDFTVPFPVNVMTGIKGIQDNDLNEDFVNERDYAIMEYLGERKAQGQYPYQKFRGVMQPNQLYSITLDSRYNYNTVRFQKTADGALVAGDNVTLHEYAGSGVYTNLNGVGNGTLHHADAGISGDYVQVYQSGEKTFLTVEKTQYSFVVGTAFMVQETGTMTLSQATHGQLLAPARQASAPATAIQIAREGQPFSDQLFISASETGGQAYTPGTDLAKAGDLGSANVPQIWTNAYNNPLCVHEAQLVNGEASYNLSIYAPAADTYTLTSQNIPADYSLYLTQNGTMLTELSGTYTLDLNKGITTEYGLLLVETYKTPTGMEEPMSQESRVKSQKILHNGVLYILHNGKIYNAQGGKVCDL